MLHLIDGAVIKDVPSYGLEVNNRFLEVCDILGVTDLHRL